jgi:hypothetical protein
MDPDIECVISFRLGSALDIPEGQRFITLRYGSDGVAYVNKKWTVMVCVRTNMRGGTKIGSIDDRGHCSIGKNRLHYAHKIIVHLRETHPTRYSKRRTSDLLETFCSHPYDMGHTQQLVVPPCLEGKDIVFKDGAIFYDDTQILDLVDAWHVNRGLSSGGNWVPELPYLVRHGTEKYLDMIYGIESPKTESPKRTSDPLRPTGWPWEGPRQVPRRNSFIVQSLQREGLDIRGGGEPLGSPPTVVSTPPTLDSIFTLEEENDEYIPPTPPRRKRKRKRPTTKRKPKPKPKKKEEEDPEEKRAKIFSECKICMDRDKTILFEPCMHLCCCKICSRKVKSCPICRSRIHKKTDVYVV